MIAGTEKTVGGDLASLLCGAIADGVMLLAIGAAAVIVLFGQSKPTELLSYLLAILVVAPLSVVLAWRRWRPDATDEHQQIIAFATLAATASVLCLARLLALPADGPLDTSLFLLLALVAARVALALCAHLLPTNWPRWFPAGAAIAATPVLLAAAAAPFVPPATLSALDIAVALTAGLATLYALGAYGDRRSPPRRYTRVFDCTVIALSTLVVVYLGRPVRELALNHNYFLGPAGDIIHGHPMLVDTFSQYGVGMMDALAAVFLVIPIGYGTFTLLLSALTALLFAGIYTVLRWSTESLPLAASGLAVAVTLYVFGQIDVYAFFPSTGVLRFGLPWLVILLSLASVRSTREHGGTRRKRALDWLVLATVALAAAWSGETAVYCLGTAGALACLDAAITDTSPHQRLRVATRGIARLLAASALGLLTFTLLTRVTAGAWANWGAYLEYIRLYTTGGLGAERISPWSPGLALGAMLAVSAITIVLLALTRPALIRQRTVAFHAATGLTALGTLVYTYFLDRAAPNNLIHISPPAVTLLFVWLGITRSTLTHRTATAIATATVIFLGAMIITSEHTNITHKYPHTALAALLGNAPPLTTEIHTLWQNPIVDPTTTHIVNFIIPLWNKHTTLTILLTPNIESETLMHLNTANAAGSSNPCQESLAQQGPARVAAAIHTLPPGGILITSTSPQDAGEILPIQKYTLAQLEAHFTLHQLDTDRHGLQAFRMSTPTPTPTPPTTPPRWAIPAHGCA